MEGGDGDGDGDGDREDRKQTIVYLYTVRRGERGDELLTLGK